MGRSNRKRFSTAQNSLLVEVDRWWHKTRRESWGRDLRVFRKHLLDDGCRMVGQAIGSKSFYGLAILAILNCLLGSADVVGPLLGWSQGLGTFLQTPSPVQGFLPEGAEFASLPSRDACLHKLRNLPPPQAVAQRGAAENTFGHHQDKRPRGQIIWVITY